jgi:hypothetical protein
VAEDEEEAESDEAGPASPATIAADRRRAEKAYAELPPINGYAEEFSVFAGDTVHIRAARKPSPGWRGWRAACLPPAISKIEIRRAVDGAVVQTRKPARTTRLLEQQPANYREEGAGYGCRISLNTADLPAGVYQCVLLSGGDTSKNIFFNIKPRALSKHDLLCVLPTFTWQAYNRLGGGSFYSASIGARRTVSTQRPLRSKGDNSIAAALPFLAAFERDGMRTACVDSSDLDRGLCPVGDAGVMTLLTHDEYWSLAMRDTVSRFVREGGSLLVLGGNTCWWKVDTAGNDLTVDKSSGRESQMWIAQSQETFVSSFRFGGYGVQHAKRSAEHAQHVLQLTEPEILRLGSLHVELPGHPVFAGVSIERDSRFGGSVPVVYREIDGVPITADHTLDETRYRVPGVTPRILATGYAVNSQGVHEAGIVVEADIGKGHVLNMGTFGWSRGLRQGNAEVTRIVLNATRYCHALALQRAAEEQAAVGA